MEKCESSVPSGTNSDPESPKESYSFSPISSDDKSRRDQPDDANSLEELGLEIDTFLQQTCAAKRTHCKPFDEEKATAGRGNVIVKDLLSAQTFVLPEEDPP